MQPIL